MKSHYDWLDRNLNTFFNSLGLAGDHSGVIAAHGDKCYQYRDFWSTQNVPFEHGVAIYMLTYEYPYSSECRETEDGWISPHTWVASNYSRFLPQLPSL